MKRLFVLSLVTVLSVGLLSVGVLAQPAPAEESENTYVEWTIDAPMQCQLTLDAHPGISLGTLDEINVAYTASGQGGVPNANRLVTTESNCEHELYFQINSVNAPISGSDVLDDFDIMVAAKNGVSNVPGGLDGSFWNVANLGFATSQSLGKAGSNANYATSDSGTWRMDYQYTTDYNDVNDYYRVNLTYTASTT